MHATEYYEDSASRLQSFLGADTAAEFGITAAAFCGWEENLESFRALWAEGFQLEWSLKGISPTHSMEFLDKDLRLLAKEKENTATRWLSAYSAAITQGEIGATMLRVLLTRLITRPKKERSYIGLLALLRSLILYNNGSQMTLSALWGAAFLAAGTTTLHGMKKQEAAPLFTLEPLRSVFGAAKAGWQPWSLSEEDSAFYHKIMDEAWFYEVVLRKGADEHPIIGEKVTRESCQEYPASLVQAAIDPVAGPKFRALCWYAAFTSGHAAPPFIRPTILSSPAVKDALLSRQVAEGTLGWGPRSLRETLGESYAVAGAEAILSHPGAGGRLTANLAEATWRKSLCMDGDSRQKEASRQKRLLIDAARKRGDLRPEVIQDAKDAVDKIVPLQPPRSLDTGIQFTEDGDDITLYDVLSEPDEEPEPGTQWTLMRIEARIAAEAARMGMTARGREVMDAALCKLRGWVAEGLEPEQVPPKQQRDGGELSADRAAKTRLRAKAEEKKCDCLLSLLDWA